MNIKNSPGLSFNFLDNGSVKSIEADPIRISLKNATPFSKPGTNLYLRKRSEHFSFKALLGPESNSSFKIGNDVFIAKGNWGGLDYECVLQLSGKSLSWQWNIDITNHGDDDVELDLIYVQDAGLKQMTDGLINQYYVSQYLERRILEDKNHGPVIFCRQNMKESTGNPWLMIASKNRSLAASVDGMQFYGKTFRETGIPEGLISDRMGGEYSGESSVLALQEAPFILSPGSNRKTVFVATCLKDHPEATSSHDLNRLPETILEFEDEILFPDLNELGSAGKNLFSTTGLLKVDDLNDREIDSFFDDERRHPEIENGKLLSFFSRQNHHIVLRAKEILVERPHGHIMQAKTGLVPDEDVVSTTSFAYGVFNSHLSQGNTNFNVFLSVCACPFNLDHETGQRIFVVIEGRYFLLGVPSAFEIGLNHCRWIYKYGDYCFQVRTWTSKTKPQVNMDFKVISGKNVRLLITHHFDSTNGWKISPGSEPGEYVARPDAGCLIAENFPDARFRVKVNSTDSVYNACGEEALYGARKSLEGPFFVLDVMETSQFCISFIGEVCSVSETGLITDPDNQWFSDCHDGRSFWQDMSLNLSLKGDHEDISAIREILPWYGMNALTHYLTPYGLEQFSGAAWGTRDIAQGPFDFLLCMEKYDEAKQVLRIIFSNQNQDGGWPQWWMFDRYSDIRADSSHGDVYYWCIIALSNYLKVTGDLKILDEILPYYHEKGVADCEKVPLGEHVDRLINMIIDSFVPGMALVPFDGGDWNDSLQPVSRELAQRMISSWTVEMNFQAFAQYRVVYEQTGNERKAKELKEICEKIRGDFNKYLVKDGVVAGYGLIEKDRTVSLLLHPSDTRTNIRYSILPMNRGIISEIFTEEQTRRHLDIIEQHLKGPDGARLMDHPLKYQGGIQTLFQRAESSTFFGREIGLMYVHEHIRYAESQARTGRADSFLKALRQAIPVACSEVVPCAGIRQSNCYYSSSDVTFKNRYEADERYDEIIAGKITLKGGWRVYSSGPGILIGIIVTRLLGIRYEFGNVIIDPVIPYSLDGLSASMDFMGYYTTFRYSVRKCNYSPRFVHINGKTVKFIYEDNKYRKGGAVIPADQFLALLDQAENIVEIGL